MELLYYVWCRPICDVSIRNKIKLWVTSRVNTRCFETGCYVKVPRCWATCYKWSLCRNIDIPNWFRRSDRNTQYHRPIASLWDTGKHFWQATSSRTTYLRRWRDLCLLFTDCKETGHGWEYTGKRSVTKTGKTCLRWDDISRDDPRYSSDDLYPDNTTADAANYCRNPDRRPTGPWCFIDKTNSETCGIPFCHGKGKQSKLHIIYPPNLIT